MKGGANSGSSPTTRKNQRKGMSRRVATKAKAKPTRVEDTVDSAVMTRLCQAACRVRGRVSTPRTSAHPGVESTCTAG